MKVIVPGHRYELDPSDPTDHVTVLHGQPQWLQFIQKEPVADGSVQLRTVMPGTTDEDVLAVLIDRLNFFQNRPTPCAENAAALKALSAALSVLQARKARRMKQGIEGLGTEDPSKAPVAKSVSIGDIERGQSDAPAAGGVGGGIAIGAPTAPVAAGLGPDGAIPADLAPLTPMSGQTDSTGDQLAPTDNAS